MTDPESPFTYQVLTRDSGPCELREKASRFISYAVRCGSQSEVESLLKSYRKRYFDATHLCYGFRLREGGQELKRSSDDGEPSGTAGIPILQEIIGKELWNILVMVIRYYGGTKLGTGGLVRAYGGCARMALDEAKVAELECTARGQVSFPYSETGLVMQWLHRFRGVQQGQEYGPGGIAMTCSLPLRELLQARQVLVDMSAGRLKWEEREIDI